MPFLDRQEMAAISCRSRGAVYEAVHRLEESGLVDSIPHAADLAPPARRYCLTAVGVRRLAQDQGTTVDGLLRSRAVSQQWRRILLERLDAIASIYRLASTIAGAARPVRLRLYRAAPLDAAITLPEGRTLGVVRQGPAADRTAFAKRLWRLSDETRPGAVLLLAPDGVRLRQARRMLDLLPVRAFLALERDGAGAGAGSPVWRAPSGPVPLSLREVLDYVRPGGELPGEAPSRRESAATDLDLDPYPAGQDAPNFLLPAMLKPAEKRALDLLFDWP